MNLINFGSLNIDHVFEVEDIVSPGQTIDSLSVTVFPGGKGLNQSLAIARAGGNVSHAGLIGSDGLWLCDLMEMDKVDCRFIKTAKINTGSAFIQVDASGQNSIVLSRGANHENSPTFCRQVLEEFNPGDLLLLQNEISYVDEIIELAYQKEMFIVLNPSPMNNAVLDCDLNKISLFIMNEDEGFKITGEKTDEGILRSMRQKYPHAQVVLTLGERGAYYQFGEKRLHQPAVRVRTVDTTGAGDTFTGYFLHAFSRDERIEDCLELAAKASAIAVTKKGAASSIPYMDQVAAH